MELLSRVKPLLGVLAFFTVVTAWMLRPQIAAPFSVFDRSVAGRLRGRARSAAACDVLFAAAAHQSCKVLIADGLIEQRFYDPTVVIIDIAPETFPNVINVDADDVVTVSIFSTNGFDATTIKPATLRLGGASLPGDDTTRRGDDDHASHHVTRTRIEDVNGDGRPDMVAEFTGARLKFNDHDIVAELWGQTRQGIPFSGTDLVQLVR